MVILYTTLLILYMISNYIVYKFELNIYTIEDKKTIV